MAALDKTPVTSRDAAPTPAVTEPPARRPQQQSLALPPAGTPPRACLPSRAAGAERLWLCLYLPSLPLETVCAAGERAAVYEEQRGMRVILQTTASAARAGVHAGLSVNAALALQPELVLQARNPARERQVLETLAGQAERYTSLVAIEPPDVLLLEIAASLRLFGGLGPLREQVARDFMAGGFSAWQAVAPTPLAATWLARAGESACIESPQKLAGAVSALPLACLAWPDGVTTPLAGMGIRGIGDCLRLPRAGFARRFGALRLLELDRALGRMPDPREAYRAPPRFAADYDLDGEQEDSERLLEVCAHLLERLARFLRTRQLAVQRVQFLFFHLRAAATPLLLSCVQAGHGTARWMELLRIRFEQLELPEPVIAIRLRGGAGQPQHADSGTLGFDSDAGRQQEERIAYLVERLSARLGDSGVHGVGTVAEHRPDYAWCVRSVQEPAPHCAAAGHAWYEQHAPQLLADMRRSNRLLLRRPLWLLETPERLACHDGTPCHAGPLTLKSGPERIETGWWDGDGLARDYYVALSSTGVHLWIFRDRARADEWYLHGIFG